MISVPMIEENAGCIHLVNNSWSLSDSVKTCIGNCKSCICHIPERSINFFLRPWLRSFTFLFLSLRKSPSSFCTIEFLYPLFYHESRKTFLIPITTPRCKLLGALWKGSYLDSIIWHSFKYIYVYTCVYIYYVYIHTHLCIRICILGFFWMEKDRKRNIRDITKIKQIPTCLTPERQHSTMVTVINRESHKLLLLPQCSSSVKWG